MNDYKIIIEGKKHDMLEIVSSFNKELFEQYSYINEDEKYIDVDKLIKDERFEDLGRIYFQCCSSIGEMVLDSEEERAEYDKLGNQIRMHDNLSKMNYQKGENEKGAMHILKGIDIVLSFYEDLLEKEKQSSKIK